MKRTLGTLVAAALMVTIAPPIASALPAGGSTLSETDAATARQLVARANTLPVARDAKAKTAGYAAYGSYSYRKGVILVTSDALKGLIPTGHAAIVYSSSQVVESVSSGVVRGANNWYSTKKQAYQTSVRTTTASQDSTAANWADRQRGKPYNWNYLDTGTRARFYCSHLVWASFKDNFGIDLNTSAFLNAVHPMELVNTPKVYLIYRKK